LYDLPAGQTKTALHLWKAVHVFSHAAFTAPSPGGTYPDKLDLTNFLLIIIV
jgi:hypothetical protein